MQSCKYMWRHRKGNEVPAAVKDTIDTIYSEDLKPNIFKTIKGDNRYTFLVTMPPGLTYSKFKQLEEHFADATGGAVQIEKQGRRITLEVMTMELKSKYPFKFEFERYNKMWLPIHFGYSAIGPIVRDLADAPNMFVAGVPGSGKSNFLHVVASCLLQSREVYMAIIDLKRLEFSYLKDFVLVVSELDNARKVLSSINKELNKRLDVLEKAAVVKIQDYNGDMPFVVLIIDELAELQDEDCQTLLNRILRLGRAAGICVVAATQRPSSTLFQKFGDSKAMFSATMCFHVRDAVNSRMVLDNDRAALMPDVKGRAIYQWEKELEVQTMFLPTKQAKKLLAQKEVSNIEPFDVGTQKRLPPR